MNKPVAPLSASFDVLPNSIAAASILPFATSAEWLNFRLTSRRCYEIVHGHDVTSIQQQIHGEEESEALWKLALVRDYRFDYEADERGDERALLYQSIRCNYSNEGDGPFLSTSDVFTASTAFESWKHWRKIDTHLHHDEDGERFEAATSARLVAPYFLRSASLWKKVEKWCNDESMSKNIGPIIMSTLHPGVPFGRSLVEDGYLNGELSAFIAIHAFYSGQSWGGELFERHGSVLPGLFGGYSVYDNVSHTCWCTPDVLSGTKLLVGKDVNEMKLVLFDYESGDVELHYRSPRLHHVSMKAVHVDSDTDDEFLRWFENHVDQLGNFSVSNLTPNNGFKSILRFPNVNDISNCSRAVTKGIEVVASSVYAPEIGNMFVYSIRIRLLSPDDEGYMSPEERGFDTCQLTSRYWRITQGGEVNEVRGEGVVGYYPLLREGGYRNLFSDDGGRTFHEEDDDEVNTEQHFSYQSCTGGGEGSMEGYLQFQAGSIETGTGEIFDVRVAPFPLKFPEDYEY